MGMLCFASAGAFAQTDDVVTETRSSAWVKVTEPAAAKPAPARPSTARTTTKTTTQPAKPEPAATKPADPFSNTNNQVKRFKKKQ